jgi:hypothetical protein
MGSNCGKSSQHLAKLIPMIQRVGFTFLINLFKTKKKRKYPVDVVSALTGLFSFLSVISLFFFHYPWD